MKQKSEIGNELLVSCKNCGNNFEGNYCNLCGQKVIKGRNTVKHLFKLLFSSLDFNRGLLFTIKLLFVNPGKLINQYLDGRTKDFMNPLKYLFIIVGISTLLTIWLNIFETSISNTNELMGIPDESLQFQDRLISFMKKYLNIFTILFIPFYSIISKLLLKKYAHNYAEHLILNSYLYAHFSLINIVPLLAVLVFPGWVNYVRFSGIGVFVIYYTYALHSIYKTSLPNSFVKAIFINLLGMLLMMFVTVMFMVLFILLMKLSGTNLESIFGG